MSENRGVKEACDPGWSVVSDCTGTGLMTISGPISAAMAITALLCV